MRGEYFLGVADRGMEWELPPRARRIRTKPIEKMGLYGTTSACAENTDVWCATDECAWNYLRVRGEYLALFLSLCAIEELPPRARRILINNQLRLFHIGTTSACAENTAKTV